MKIEEVFLMQHFSTESLFDVMGELFSDEISIGITDEEKYLYFRPSKRIDLKIKSGDIIKEGTLAHKALTSGQKISEYISRDIYGVPYHGMAAPIRDKNKINGTVLAVYPTVTEGKSVITVRTEDGWKPLRSDLKIKSGDIIKEGTLAHKALTSGQKISEYISRDIYGVPYHGMAAPIRDKNKINGTVLAVYPTVTEGKSVITVRTEDGWKPLPFNDVIYLEVKDRKTHIITESFQGTHNQTLQEFEYVLPKEMFIRCQR